MVLAALRAPIALTAVVAVAVAILIVVIASGGSSGPQSPRQAVAQVERLLAGIPESGARLGSPRAPVKLVFYGDLECPISRRFTLTSFVQLVRHYVRSGRVQVIYRSFRIATPTQKQFLPQQAAALAAGKQNRFWYYALLFYHEQGKEGSGRYVTASYLDGLARQVPGLNYSTWFAARSDPALQATVAAQERAAVKVGVRTTPTLVFEGPRGRVGPFNWLSGFPTFPRLQRWIRQAQ